MLNILVLLVTLHAMFMPLMSYKLFKVFTDEIVLS
jgi:hypothetical protein